MKLNIAVLGLLLLGAAHSAGGGGQDPPAVRDSPAGAQQTLAGCVDQQDGQYVLLDSRMETIASLKSAGPDIEIFAKHLGHIVKVKGTHSSAKPGVFTVTGIEQLPGRCGVSR